VLGWVLVEISGIQLLVSARIEVTLDNGVCNGHIMNRWHMKIWFAILCLFVLGEIVAILDEATSSGGSQGS
jgi:hypothetical protein